MSETSRNPTKHVGQTYFQAITGLDQLLSFIHNFIIFWAEGEPGGGEVGHAAESDP
jgi:hypothetical protein